VITIPELTLEVRETIKVSQAHRFPELRYFPKPGDDGKEIKLPVILGNPSGACRMPKGERVSRAWAASVTATFKQQSEPFDYGPLVTDCVLWPDPRTWASWTQRWPALADSVRPALVRKYGGAQALISEPGPEEEQPAELTEALATHPGASWLRFSPKGTAVDLVVTAPTSFAWASFTEAMKRPNADTWALTLDMATACTPAATKPIADLFARWPGLPLLVMHHASYLAGLATAYEEGEL
jgi:hypothetical protein